MNLLDEDSLWRRVKKRLKCMPLVAIPLMFCRILRGYGAYRHILRTCPPEEGWRIYFMDYDGSGDTYLTCSYLQAKNQLDANAAFAAAGGLSLKIAELFPFGRYTSDAPKAAMAARMMERFLGQRLRVQPVLYESVYLEYSGILRRMTGCRGLDFMSMLKIGLEINCNIPYEEGPWEQPEFPYASAEVDEILHTYDLIPGKTILLAPYAGKNKMWGISVTFYEELVQRLHGKGFMVCTNSSDTKREPPIPGTMPLRIPHRLMRPFCEQAGYFIGLRSGLCDIISSAKACKKIVLYASDMNSCFYGICTHQQFFSLKNMKLCEEAVEIEVDMESFERIIERIIKQFL